MTVVVCILALVVMWFAVIRLLRWLGPSPLDHRLAQARAASDAANARPEWLDADRERMQP